MALVPTKPITKVPAKKVRKVKHAVPKKEPKKESSRLNKALVAKAVSALLKHHEEQTAEKHQLLGTDLTIFAQIGLEVAPIKATIKPIRILIPHSIYQLGDDEGGSDEPEVCLIVKDDAKAGLQELLAKFPEMKMVKKILTLTSLRQKHAQYAQRRELLAKYSHFMADDRILPMLTTALGKHFILAKKQPVPIKVTRKEALPFAILSALRATYLILPSGTCVTLKVGATNLAQAKLVDNVVAACDGAARKIPRSWANICNISLKSTKSAALPIYNKTPQELREIAELAGLSDVWKPTVAPPVNDKGEKMAPKKRKMKSPLLQALQRQKAIEESSETPQEETIERPEPARSSKRAKSAPAKDIGHTKSKDSAQSKPKAVSELKVAVKGNKTLKVTKEWTRTLEANAQDANDLLLDATQSEPVKKDRQEKIKLDETDGSIVLAKSEKKGQGNVSTPSGDVNKREKPQMETEGKTPRGDVRKAKGKVDKLDGSKLVSTKTNAAKDGQGNVSLQSKESSKQGKRKVETEETTPGDNGRQAKVKADKLDGSKPFSKTKAKPENNFKGDRSRSSAVASKREERKAETNATTKAAESTTVFDKNLKKDKQEGGRKTFIVAQSFQGSKAGYAFKQGQQGLGYYLDVKPVVDFAAIKAFGRKETGKTNRRSKSPGGCKRNGKR